MNKYIMYKINYFFIKYSGYENSRVLPCMEDG